MPSNNIKHYLCWLAIALFYLLENCLQVSQGIFAPEMQKSLGLSDQQLAQLTSAFMWSYAPMQIPVGIILDRIGLRKPLLIAVLIFMLGTLICAFANSYLLVLVGRIFLGFGAAFVVLSALNYAGSMFDKNKFATLTGLLLTIGMSGQILGEAPLLALINHVGWRSSLFFMSACSAFIFIILFILIPKPQFKNLENKASSIIDDIKNIMQQKKYWSIAIYAMLRFSPFLLFAAFWGVKLLPLLHNLSTMQAATIVGMLPLGFAIGAPIWGNISDRSGKRLPVLIISNLLEIILWFSIIITSKIILLEIISLLLGFSISGFLPAFSLMRETADPKITTTALGFMNTLNSLGLPIILPIMTGIHKLGSHSQTMLVLPVITICASIGFFTLKEANAKT